MKIQTYQRLRLVVAIFIATTVSVAVTQNNSILAAAAALTGMVFMLVIKSKVKGILIDERMQAVGDKAARITFNIVTMVLGLSSVVLVFFGRTSAPYLEGLGYILSYLTLFCLMLYSAAYYYFNRKYGADDKE